MPTVLVTGHTVTQNSPFSSLAVAVIIASTHFASPRMDDQAELAWAAWLNTEMVYPRTVTHLSTNQDYQARRSNFINVPNGVKPNRHRKNKKIRLIRMY